MEAAILCLNSLGGSYQEALEITKYLLSSMIPTVVDANARCYSACAIIFLGGGMFEEATHVPNRWLHVRGELGFHAPYLQGIESRSYTAAEIEEAARLGIRAIRALARLARGYHVSDTFLPKALLVEIVSKEPWEAFVVDTTFKATKLDILLFGARTRPPVTVSTLGNACQHLFSDTGQTIELDEPPAAWIAPLQGVTRQGDLFWFPEYRGEGSGFCIAKLLDISKGKFAIYRTTTLNIQALDQSDFAEREWWFLLAPNVKLKTIQ
jgi:hypothetical protein